MDKAQRPLAKMTGQYFNASGVLLYTTYIDFSIWTKTVTNPRNGKSATCRIDRSTGQRAGSFAASQAR